MILIIYVSFKIDFYIKSLLLHIEIVKKEINFYLSKDIMKNEILFWYDLLN